MTPKQQLAIRAELARAMFPNAVIESSSTGEGVDIRVYDKPNETRTWYNFDPFTNAADNRALVARMAENQAYWLAFRKELLLCWAVLPADVALSHGYYEKWLLTLPYETITLAAARALGIQEAGE